MGICVGLRLGCGGLKLRFEIEDLIQIEDFRFNSDLGFLIWD